MPEASTRHGTSTAQPSGSEVMRRCSQRCRRSPGLARPHRVHDRGGVFLAAFDVCGLHYSSRGLAPALDLLDAAARVLVQRDAELLDQVGTSRLMKYGVYSAKCSLLGDEVAEPREHS